MEKALTNALIFEAMTRLSMEERKEAVLELRNKYKCSYRELAKKLNRPESTINDWANGGGKTHSKNLVYININNLNEYFDGYKPRLAEFEKIAVLNKMLEKILNKDYSKSEETE